MIYYKLLVIFFLLTGVAAGATVVDTEGAYAVSGLVTSGDRLVTGHFDGKIRIIDPASSKHIMTLEGHTKPLTGLSADLLGKYILSSSQDGSLILWDAPKGKMVKRINKPGISFRACALDPSGRYALAAFASSVYVWDTSTWENVAIWEKIEGGVYSIAVNESGMAALGGAGGRIYIYSVPEGDKIKTLKSGDKIIASVAFAPNSGLLFSGGYDKTARVWDVDKGVIVKEFSGHSDTVRSVAAGAGGKKFATAGDDGAVILWDISGKSESYSSAGSPPSTALALDPALRFIAAGKGAIFENNKYITMWYPGDRRQSRNIYAFSDALAVVSPLGYVDGTGSFADYVTIYENGRGYQLSQVARKYNRPERLNIHIGSGYKPKK